MLDLSKTKKKNICIIGLMGSGKSIIGKELSKSLDLKFYDTDREIEVKTKKSINAIFKERGEPYFRGIEEEICIELLNKDNCVISLGGGSVVNKKIMKEIINNSFSIYLRVNVNNLEKRLTFSNKRPLLIKNHSKKQILENLFNVRRKFYEKADLIVDNDNGKSQVLEKIKFELNSYAK